MSAIPKPSSTDEHDLDEASILRLWCMEHQCDARTGDPRHRTCLLSDVHPKAIRRGSVALGEETAARAPRRTSSGVEGFDRVIGGGFVDASTIFLTGDPGCGKSSLLALLSKKCAERGAVVLYASGEESVEQIRLRTSAVGEHANIHLMHSSSLEDVEREINALRPHLVIYDSLQRFGTMRARGAAAGSGTAVKAVAERVLFIAKKGPVKPISIIVGHVIKDGSAAGPESVQHDFDTLLHFSLDEDVRRVLVSGKNRFGASGERALFEFVGTNVIQEVRGEAVFLAGALTGGVGCLIFPAAAGAKGVALALEAYVTLPKDDGPAGIPTLSAKGLSESRVRDALELLHDHTSSLDRARTIRVRLRRGDGASSDAALDAALCAALVSSAERLALPPGAAVFGELSPAGRLDSDPSAARRVQVAHAAGARRIAGPMGGMTLPGLDYDVVTDLGDVVRWVRRHGVFVPTDAASQPRSSARETSP